MLTLNKWGIYDYLSITGIGNRQEDRLLKFDVVLTLNKRGIYEYLSTTGIGNRQEDRLLNFGAHCATRRYKTNLRID